ncbi:MAG: small acid-soluble spore protein SspI [Erysipelotrichales bacterium]|nr:small acid-soluble spore protein SspI [Erysipelotrichales bacterium]
MNERKEIIKMLSNVTYDDLRLLINEAVKETETEALSFLGVLFELLWKKSTAPEKAQYLTKVVNTLI